jgi:hypothetical protein
MSGSWLPAEKPTFVTPQLASAAQAPNDRGVPVVASDFDL